MLSGIEEGREVSCAGGGDRAWIEDDAGDGTRWRVSGACLVEAGDRLADTGALTDGDARSHVAATAGDPCG